MTGDDNLETTLTRLGADDGPPADPAFANRLDAVLRAAHSAQLHDDHRRSVWVPVTAGVSALAAMVVGALIWLVAFAGDPAAEVVMTAAFDTQVIIPGEAASTGEAGLLLPDGTRIVVGLDGEAVVDGVVLGPGAEAVIDDGRVVIGPARSAPTDRRGVVPETSQATSLRSMASTTVPNADDDSDGDTSSSTRRPTSSTGDGPATSAPTTATQPPEPTDGSRATSTQTSSTRPTTTTAAAPTTTATTDRAPLSITLTAMAVPRSRIRLDWITEGAPDLAAFRVEAAAGDRTSTIVVIRSSGARSTTIERLPPGASYRVVAIAEDGTTLQSSNSVPQPSP
ncbi:MAG: hypothetical protein ACR2QO_04685 [Acidimicrobiales bacterium]